MDQNKLDDLFKSLKPEVQRRVMADSMLDINMTITMHLAKRMGITPAELAVISMDKLSLQGYADELQDELTKKLTAMKGKTNASTPNKSI